MRARRFGRLWAGLALALCLPLWSPLKAEPAAVAFRFVALGDMPYGPAMLSHPAYERLIARINALTPAFSLHVGDFKSGSSPCSDEAFLEQLRLFNQFTAPLVYTPGDNEWTDCHRTLAGRYDPRERLAKLRHLFFAQPASHGQIKLALERQADGNPQWSTFVENIRFQLHGVHFVGVHIVGSKNGLEPREPAAVEEFRTREQAVVSWLEDSFAKAERAQAFAMVVFFHADPFERAGASVDFAESTGFERVIGQTLLPLAGRTARPVLVIHGDSHVYRLDRPFRDARGQAMKSIQRLEVFGAPDTRAVEVSVDPHREHVFSFTVIENPAP